MDSKGQLITANMTVQVSGGTNVLRNIFHFNTEAIEIALTEAFGNLAQSTDFEAASAAQVGASITYAEERAVLRLGIVLDIECNPSSNNFDYSKSLLNVVYSEQFVEELYESTTLESLIRSAVVNALYDLAEGDESIDYEGMEVDVDIERAK